MDPNAEQPPPSVEVAEVGVDFGLAENPLPPPSLSPPLASSIFRHAREPGWDSPHEEVDQEKVRQWQEEEFQRRLRGEYEQAQQRVGEVVYNNMERPLRLSSIRLSPPPPTTRPAFLNSLLSPFLSTPSRFLPTFLHPAPAPPETLHEILISTKALVQHLERFGVFDMGKCAIKLEPKRGGDLDEIELVLGLREKGKFFLKAGTEVGGGEGGG
ncbi:hypothetical protein P7C73_g6533, partial [Tremellales sp. Uapishka_1]